MEDLQKQWPAYWLHYIRGEIKAQNEAVSTTDATGATKVSQGSIRYDCGAGVKINKDSSLTYTCPCGATFHRHPGDKNQEARDWVKAHTPHLGELNDAPL